MLSVQTTCFKIKLDAEITIHHKYYLGIILFAIFICSKFVLRNFYQSIEKTLTKFTRFC